jgi:archaellin
VRPYAGGDYVSISGMTVEIRAGENWYSFDYNPQFFDANPPGMVFDSKAWPTAGGGEKAAEIQAQIDELEGNIAKEQDRRRPDEDQIAEWEQEIRDLEVELAALPSGGIDAFGCIAVTDSDGSMASAFPAMNTGDVALLTISVEGKIGNIGDRLRVDGKVYSEAGVPAIFRFTTPSAIPHKVFDLM